MAERERERRTGAGAKLAGLLETRAPLDQVEPDEPGGPEASADAGPSPAKGRGVAAPKPRPAARAPKRVKGRTLYIPDDLWERIIVQAHRRDKNYSDYVVAILERQVPDHRVIRADPAQGPAETDAA
jgi:hypothetical protein